MITENILSVSVQYIMKYFRTCFGTAFVLECMIIGLLGVDENDINDLPYWMPVNISWEPSTDECPTWEGLEEVKCQPLLKPQLNFDPSNDVEELHRIIQTKKYNELKNILVKTSDERVAIRKAYEEKHKTDLSETIKYELDGIYLRLVLSLIKSKIDFYQSELMYVLRLPDAKIRKSYLKTNSLIEIIGCLSIQGLKALDASFLKRGARDYCYQIESFLAPRLYRYDITLCDMKERPENMNVSEAEIEKDLEDMLNAKTEREFSPQLNRIIGKRSNAHLRKLLTAYERETAQDIRTTMYHIFSPWYYKPIRGQHHSMVDFWDIIRNRSLYFATRLYKSLPNHWYLPNYDTLRRILIGRAEIDLGNILIAFENKYNMTLADHIKKRITKKANWEYRDFLLEFIKQFSTRGSNTESANSRTNDKVMKDEFMNYRPESNYLNAVTVH